MNDDSIVYEDSMTCITLELIFQENKDKPKFSMSCIIKNISSKHSFSNEGMSLQNIILRIYCSKQVSDDSCLKNLKQCQDISKRLITLQHSNNNR